MLFEKTKDEALNIHERARKKYNDTVSELNKTCADLYDSRTKSKECIAKVEELVNSIANTPREFKKTFEMVHVAVKKFNETENYARESLKNAREAGVNVAAGVGTGATVASLAPSAMMWVATTFGTASTGTAIAELSGAVATKAALAWLGGGALSAGGAGVVGGQALLAMAGPIGWGIAGATAAVSASALGIKNKQLADTVIEEAREITMAGAKLKDTVAVVNNLKMETNLLLNQLSKQYEDYYHLWGADYTAIPSENQIGLGAMVNNTRSLGELLNKTVGDMNAG